MIRFLFALAILTCPPVFADENSSQASKERSDSIEWSTDPVLTLKFLKQRDREFRNRTITVDRIWTERISPLGQIGQRNFAAMKFGQPRPDTPDPADVPPDYDQPHRVRYKLTTREPDISLEVVGEQEKIKHPEYSSISNKGYRSSNIGDLERSYHPQTNKLTLKEKPERRGMGSLRPIQWQLEWGCGYGVATMITSIDSMTPGEDRLKIKGRMALLGDDESQFEMSVDRNYIIRDLKIDVPTRRSGFDTYVAKTEGTVWPKVGPPVARFGHYQRILRPEGKPARVYKEYNVEFVSVSGFLTEEEYKKQTEIEVPEDVRTFDMRRKK